MLATSKKAGGVALRTPAAGVRADTFSALSMYAEQPTDELTLEDFEICAFERLKVLRAIDSAKGRGMKPEELDKLARDQAKAHIGESLESAETYRRDCVSHHILRLAFCNSEDKRRLFCSSEAALFKARVARLAPGQVAFFMDRHGMHLAPLGEEERMELAQPLRQTWDAMGGGEEQGEGDSAPASRKFEATVFYKVPFLQAVDLVRTRRVYLRGGVAYVPHGRIVAIIVNRFTTYLKHALVMANKALPPLLADERLEPILKSMASAYTGPDFAGGGRRGGVQGEGVRAEEVDGLAGTAFPLCMQSLHEALRASSHLKHWGRQQYGLFLKGVGLSLEDSLALWQRHFTRKMGVDEFLKKYAYNIRHNYGKEGKRADYTPYSCTRIIVGNAPGPDDAHGCPFRHWDAPRLKSVLERARLAPAAVDGILEAVRNRDFQIACRKQFEARFPGAESGSVGNHPNAYFAAAHAAIKGVVVVGEGAFVAGSAVPTAAPPVTAPAGGEADEMKDNAQ